MQLQRLALILVVLAAQGAPQQKGNKSNMSPQQVVEQVRKKDRSVLESGRIGADSSPALVQLLKDRDPDVRELAVRTLDLAGGPVATDGLFQALQDPIEMTRAAAARSLHTHATAANLPVAKKELSSNRLEYVREQMALLIGEIGGSPDIPTLLARRSVEKDEPAKHAILLALCRLGHPPSIQEFLQQLTADDPAIRVARLEDLPYINDRKLAHYVLPLLDDLRDGKNVGPSHGPTFIRVCDVAINELDKLLNHPFPFIVEFMRRYSPDEIARAKMFL